MAAPETRSERNTEQEQEKWYEKARYQVLLFVGGIALFSLVLWLILDWYINPETSTQKKDLVQALGLITAGVAGAVGIYFTWRGQRLTQRAQEENQKNTQEQLKNAREELHLTREGQITERFTRAIDQLGSENLEIRLGGIYALERISKESEEDYWPIMEILTAYVRERSPRKWEESPDEISTDPEIHAIMTVLRRRTGYFGNGEPEPLNLRGTNLKGVNLRGANLMRADLRKADLVWADLRATNLEDAHLEEARFGNVAFGEDISWGWRWKSAQLRGARLRGANLLGVNLENLDLQETIGLTQQQLNQASGDDSIDLPPGLKPPAHWGVKTDEQTEGD